MTYLSTPNPFAHLKEQGTVLLTTYRRDGRPVGTPVSIAIVDDHAVFRTYDRAWKTRRLAHTPRISIAPSNARGKPTGPPVEAVAHRITGTEALAAARALRRKHPILHGVLVPLGHRIRRYTTIYYRVDLPETDQGHGGHTSGADHDTKRVTEGDAVRSAP